MDGTMCSGKDCPLKESCYRFTANASEHWQSYFTEPPIIKRHSFYPPKVPIINLVGIFFCVYKPRKHW